MKYRSHAIVLGVAAAAFAAGRWAPTFEPLAQAQPDKKQPANPSISPDMQKKMDDAAKRLQPGAEHKVLDVLVGDWQGSVKMWMDPNAAPMESKGTIHREWVLDNHFVHEEVKGDAMQPGGAPFHAMGIIGYNTIDKRYECGWVENMATWITVTDGTYDAAKKTFTFSGEGPNGMTGLRQQQRMVLDCSNSDRQVITGWTLASDGAEVKSFEGTFERVKK